MPPPVAAVPLAVKAPPVGAVESDWAVKLVPEPVSAGVVGGGDGAGAGGGGGGEGVGAGGVRPAGAGDGAVGVGGDAGVGVGRCPMAVTVKPPAVPPLK